MPRVGKKHFPYTSKGKAEAKSYAKGFASSVKGGAGAVFNKLMNAGAGKNAKPPIGSAASKEPKTPRGSARSTVSPGERDAVQAAEARRQRLMDERNQRILEEDAKAKGVKLPPRSSQQRGRRRR